jgi:hypothetical protein
MEDWPGTAGGSAEANMLSDEIVPSTLSPVFDRQAGARNDSREVITSWLVPLTVTARISQDQEPNGRETTENYESVRKVADQSQMGSFPISPVKTGPPHSKGYY